jgi:flagellar motor switch protein FliG
VQVGRRAEGLQVEIQQVGANLDVKCMQKAQQKFLSKVQKMQKIGKNMDFWDIRAFFG